MIAGARRLAIASLLGLPTALFAHALVFGSEHAAGGALSTAIMAGSVFGVLLAVAIHSRRLMQGSVLATRVREQLPCFAALAVSGSVWFTAIELCERVHNVPLAAIALAIAAACILLRLAVSAIASSIAQFAIVLTNGEHAAADLTKRTSVTSNAPSTLRSFAHTRRLFSRPPPALS